MPFYRFPHTPHLAWLGTGSPRDDKVMSAKEAATFLQSEIVVEEKIDGANIGFSIDDDGTLRVQNRGSYIDPLHCSPQFLALFRWLEPWEDLLYEALFPKLMLFGEWCYVVHSVRYTALPDWFLAFDVFDPVEGAFWNVTRRDELIRSIGLYSVPLLARGRFGLEELQSLMQQSRYSESPCEGLYLRREGPELTGRAKLVRKQFTQAIGKHWSRGEMKRNSLMVVRS